MKRAEKKIVYHKSHMNWPWIERRGPR